MTTERCGTATLDRRHHLQLPETEASGVGALCFLGLGTIGSVAHLLNDVNFRKALSYAFDYDVFITNILSGSVARNPGPLPNNIWGAPKISMRGSHLATRSRSVIVSRNSESELATDLSNTIRVSPDQEFATCAVARTTGSRLEQSEFATA